MKCEYCGRECGYTCERSIEGEAYKEGLAAGRKEKSPLLEAARNQLDEANEVIKKVDELYEGEGIVSPYYVTMYLERWNLLKK